MRYTSKIAEAEVWLRQPDWYRLAEAQGHPGAQFALALHYAKGHGVHQDDGEAVRWATLAAHQGHMIAQYNLGIMYAAGRGVERQDDVQAAKWYGLSAQQGYTLAQSSLALQYKLGLRLGMARDPIQALMWLTIAARQGDTKAVAERDNLTLSMTPVEIAEAQKLAREWKPAGRKSP